MNKPVKITIIALILILTAATLLFLARTRQAAPNSSLKMPANGQNAAQKQSSTSQDTLQAPAATSPKSELEPLPADDKQAIDTELSNIENDLGSADNSVSADDLSNTNLGL